MFGSATGIITVETPYDITKLKTYEITVTASISGTTIPALSYTFILQFSLPECTV